MGPGRTGIVVGGCLAEVVLNLGFSVHLLGDAGTQTTDSSSLTSL